MADKILDMCCGSKMFWFDRNHANTVFMDKRRERLLLPDRSTKGGSRVLLVDPMLVADFTKPPFKDRVFSLVVFDPPHFNRNGKAGWMAKKYGTRGSAWREELSAGFREAFRVACPFGTIVFKWNSGEVAVSEVIKLSPAPPLFGNKYGKRDQTHWLVFRRT